MVSICFNTFLFHLLHFICYFKSLLVNRLLVESLSSIQLIQMQPISFICCLVSLSALMLSACSCCKIEVSLLGGKKALCWRQRFLLFLCRQRKTLPESEQGWNCTRNSFLTPNKSARGWEKRWTALNCCYGEACLLSDPVLRIYRHKKYSNSQTLREFNVLCESWQNRDFTNLLWLAKAWFTQAHSPC